MLQARRDQANPLNHTHHPTHAHRHPGTSIPTVVIGVLQIRLHVRGSQSLKDKRRVIKSLKDRLHREHLAAVAEVDLLDHLTLGTLAVAIIGRDGQHVGQTLDRIAAKARAAPDAQVVAMTRQLLHGVEDWEPPEDPDRPDTDLADEMLRRATEPGDHAR